MITLYDMQKTNCIDSRRDTPPAGQPASSRLPPHSTTLLWPPAADENAELIEVEDTKLFVSHRFAKKLVAAKVGGADGTGLRWGARLAGCPLLALLVAHRTACESFPYLPAQIWQLQLMFR